MTSANNAQLRHRLSEMTESGTEPSTHAAKLAAISQEFPHTIKPLEFQLPEDRYTCGMYVFDFSEDPDYLEIAGFHLPHRQRSGDATSGGIRHRRRHEGR